jgi:hypothetical protein
MTTFTYQSEIKVPVGDWSTVKKLLLSTYNSYLDFNLVIAAQAYSHLVDERPKGARKYNYRTTFDNFINERRLTQGPTTTKALNPTLVWESLWSEKSLARNRPVQPRKSFYRHVNNQTKCFSMEYAEQCPNQPYEYDHYAVEFVVNNGNKTIEVKFTTSNEALLENCYYPMNPVLTAFINKLTQIDWDKNTGGTVKYPVKDASGSMVIETTVLGESNTEATPPTLQVQEETSEFPVTNIPGRIVLM